MKKTLFDQDFKLDVIQNMKEYGGSFVQALAVAIQKADDTNLDKIHAVFQNYIDQYDPKNWIKNDTQTNNLKKTR